MNNLIKFFEDLYDGKTDDLSRFDEFFDRVIGLLNDGIIRVTEQKNEVWCLNSWIKKAILMGFKYKKEKKMEFDGFDKIGLLKPSFRYRKVPGSFIRDGVYVADDAVVMPSYINIGAYVGKRTMIDIHSCIGSCAQIGDGCHISACSCIGGVLEPAVSFPVIIEDNCFIGAGSSVLEGMIVKKNSIIAAGVIVSSSTKIIERDTGDIHVGIIPSGSVVVPGSYQTKNGLNINCAVIVKKNNFSTQKKVSINEILRGA